MFSLASMFLFSILGLKFDGLNGLCVGAAIGWLFCFWASVGRDRESKQREDRLSAILDEQTSRLEGVLGDISSRLVKTLGHLIDQMPTSSYRTLHNIGEGKDDRWEVLRRHLVLSCGLHVPIVDEAKNELLFLQMSGVRLPWDEKSLIEARNAVRNTLGAQVEEIRRYGP